MSLHDSELQARVVLAIKAAARGPLPEPVEGRHSLISDLKFDSLTMSLLSLELENQLDAVVILDEWIGGTMDLDALTVDSLCQYLRAKL